MPTSREETLFCRLQEGVRKCVERVFNVLFRRFKSLFIASELWNPEKMKSIFEAAVIMHSQIVEDHRDYYPGDGARGLGAKCFEDEDESDIVLHSFTSNEIPSLALATSDIKLQGYHRKITRALVDHIWCRHGKA